MKPGGPDLAGYVSGDLGPEERVEVERRLAADPELRREADELQALAGHLDRLPPGAWRTPPRDRTAGVPAPRRRAAAGLAALVAAVALGATGFLVLGRGGDDRSENAPLRLEALTGERGAGTARLRTAAGTRRLEMQLRGLPPTGERRFYEVWLLGPGRRIVSLGSFRVDASGRASMDLPVPVDPSRYRFVDVSREPDDDNPAHSGRSVLRAPAS